MAPKSLSILVVIIVGIGLLFYFAKITINERGLPSLADYIASSTEPTVSSTTSVAAPNGLISTFVMTTPLELARGLSGRESLGTDEGMLFLFPQSGSYGFWMKDMHFPIDIIWIDESKKVIGIKNDATPDSYPQTFMPPAPVRFVLELNSGSAARFGIATGTVLVF